MTSAYISKFNIKLNVTSSGIIGETDGYNVYRENTLRISATLPTGTNIKVQGRLIADTVNWTDITASDLTGNDTYQTTVADISTWDYIRLSCTAFSTSADVVLSSFFSTISSGGSVGTTTFTGLTDTPTVYTGESEKLVRVKTDETGLEFYEFTVSTSTFIEDADGDTKVETEKNADEDKVRITCASVERVLIEDNGVTITGDTNDGTTKPLSIKDSDDVEQVYVNSDGQCSSTFYSSSTPTFGNLSKNSGVAINNSTGSVYLMVNTLRLLTLDNNGLNVPRNGLFGSNGTVSTPAISFGSAGDMGFYKNTTNDSMVVSVNDTAVAEFDDTTCNTHYMPTKFASYTTTERDALTPAAGWVLFNTTTSKLQCYDGSTWNDLF